MNPNEVSPTLDPQVVNLAKAIRQTESGGNFQAKGKSGEYGAYQNTPDTWAARSKAAGINVPIDKATPEQQNEVFYKWAKSKKDEGYNVGQIASMNNAGEGEPNAYQGKFSNGQVSTGTNKYGVKFDVPAYAKSVATAYQTLKNGGQVEADPNNPSSTAAPQGPGFIQGVVQGLAKPFLQVGLGVERAVQGAGALLSGDKSKINEAAQSVTQPQDFGYLGKVNVGGFDENGKPLSTGKQVQTALGTGAEIGSYLTGGGEAAAAKDAAKEGLLKALGKGALKGAFIGSVAGGGASAADPNAGGSQIAQNALQGGLTGGVLGTAGAGITRALESIPKSLTETAFKGLTPEQASHALETKSIGTKESLLNQSQKSLESYGTKIDDILKNKSFEVGSDSNAIQKTLEQFPEFNSPEGEGKMFEKIKSLISSNNTAGEDRATILSYIDNIRDGTSSIFERNKVRSALDRATSGSFGKLARAINPSAGQDVAMTFADALRNEVKTSVPETQKLFSEFSKEINLNKALQKIVKKPTGGLLRWRDIVPFLGGNALGGLPGGLAGAALSRASENPAVQFGAAKVLQGASKAVNPVASRLGLLAPLIQNRVSVP